MRSTRGGWAVAQLCFTHSQQFSRTSKLTARLGPTREERAIADAGVEVAAAIVAVVAARVGKIADSRAFGRDCRPALSGPGRSDRPQSAADDIAKAGHRWASFNLREDQLNDLSMGSPVELTSTDHTIR